MKKYLFALTIFLLSNYLFANDIFHLCSKPINPALFNLAKASVEVIKKTDKTLIKTEIDFSKKNGYNPNEGVIWREFPPNDGQTWWIDENLNVYWRYLKQGENPQDIGVGVRQTLANPFQLQSSSRNCSG